MYCCFASLRSSHFECEIETGGETAKEVRDVLRNNAPSLPVRCGPALSFRATDQCSSIVTREISLVTMVQERIKGFHF